MAKKPDETTAVEDVAAAAQDTIVSATQQAGLSRAMDAHWASVESQRADSALRLEALKLAIAQGGSDAIVREKAEAFLAFLKGEPAPEKAGE